MVTISGGDGVCVERANVDHFLSHSSVPLSPLLSRRRVQVSRRYATIHPQGAVCTVHASISVSIKAVYSTLLYIFYILYMFYILYILDILCTICVICLKERKDSPSFTYLTLTIR